MPKLKSRVLSMSLAAVVGAVGLGLGVAIAHPASDFYWLHEWKASHHTGLHITWRFEPTFPDGARRDRVRESFGKWNDLNQQMEFEQLAEADFTFELPCPESQGYNGILSRNLANGVAAETRLCDHESGSTPHAIHNFWIAFQDDGSVDWYGFDNPDNIRSNELDFEAVATHEIGHGTGWAGHFFEVTAPNCTNPDTQPTMCPGYRFGSGSNSVKARSLEDHDKHTFDNNYPDG
jgi:hypothetical protein